MVWSRRNGCHARWMGTSDIDIHHRRIGTGPRVDVLIIRIVNPHFAAVSYRRGQ
jgi:hypothetical protein